MVFKHKHFQLEVWRVRRRNEWLGGWGGGEGIEGKEGEASKGKAGVEGGSGGLLSSFCAGVPATSLSAVVRRPPARY